MEDHARTRARRTRSWIRPIAALAVTLPLLAGPDPAPSPSPAASPAASATEAAKTAKATKKMQKAIAKGRAAKEEREMLQHFQHELDEYAALHNKQMARIDTKDPAAVQKAMAQAIAAKRDKAEQGDILRPEAEALFRRLIAEQLKGPDAGDARKAVRDGNPEVEKTNVAPVDVRVNAPYPVGAPLSTVPPSVLLALPALPDCLNYRFVGRDLVLVDATAQLIVDYLSNAAPNLAVP